MYMIGSEYLWVSVQVPICCQRRPLWWQLDKTPVCEYCQISLRIISLYVLASYAWFYHRSLAYPLSSSWPFRKYRAWDLSPSMSHKLKQTLVGHYNNFSATIVLAQLAGRKDYWDNYHQRGFIWQLLISDTETLSQILSRAWGILQKRGRKDWEAERSMTPQENLGLKSIN